MKIRILLANDHAIIREGLRSLIERQADMEVVAETENGRSALQLARKLTPDVVLMDISMPGLNGIEATRQIVEGVPGARVIVLSMHSDKRFVAETLKAGASRYLLKDCAFEELASAIRSVMESGPYPRTRIGKTVIGKHAHPLKQDEHTVIAVLTPRERDVLQLMAEGKTTRNIASLLHVSVKTVETHRQHIMAKLDIHSIAELTKYAIREGLTSL
ncbi:MAG: response regulator transcription factor [Deltaproteobacteria bacterium]|nr:response regulator transcription factor [Deltaproteobacteria bacterium]